MEFHRLASEGSRWKEKGSLASEVFGRLGFPGSARQEVLGIVGVGELGRSSFASFEFPSSCLHCARDARRRAPFKPQLGNELRKDVRL